MQRYLLALLFLVVSLHGEQYPLLYKQLSHPLFKSSKAIQNLSNIKAIEKSLDSYNRAINRALTLGKEVDKTRDARRIKEYLFTLRKLQKKYDAILYLIHKEISSSVDKKDFKCFMQLTAYEFDGLLQNRALYKKSLVFYKENKKTKTNDFFEKRIEYTQLEVATAQEFQDEVETSSYDSSKKQKKKRKVNLEVVDGGKYYDVFIENFNPYSVTVNVKGSYKNLASSHSNKEVVSIKAGEKKKYLRLSKIKGALSYSYSFSYTWVLGDIDAVHDDSFIYRFPFQKGTSVRVSQGFNGTTTHNGRSKYAIDFAMPTGTKIYAARAGVVVKIKENSNKGGYAKEFSSYGNYVTIEHEDATFATYYHLKQYGALVRVGDKVKKGALIAYSGNTGYSSGPHLHFAVFKANSATSTQTIKIKFLGIKKIIHYIEKNVFYTAK
ncbi:MAG: M23 family metallopeptidase [Sulfurimonas sp.]|nr:M23 family metallopeptidase [Sulfurimonas sp.]